MEFLFEYGLFLAKAATIVTSILIIAGMMLSLSMRGRHEEKEYIEVKSLNDRYDGMSAALESMVLPKKALKEKYKARKKETKAENKKSVDQVSDKKRVFVLDFDGDIRGSDVATMREEITAILTTANDKDEVVLRLESGGGMVHAYGLAASQLKRIKDAKIPLTISVDKVAASGGYMMACVANKIIAAPFAILGSIGVLTQIPNFHKILKKNDVDFEQIIAGEYKRTVTMFGETTDKARAKLKEEVEETHEIFKHFIEQERPAVDIAKVATGEHWLGSQALELKLVDELRTSDDYLLCLRNDAEIFQVEYKTKQTLIEKFSDNFARIAGKNMMEKIPDSKTQYFL